MRLFRLITNGLAPLTLLGAVVAYLMPELFLPVKGFFQWLFAATMFALGIVLKPAELTETLRAPGNIAKGVATQYTLMPLLGFAAATFGGLPDALALGFVIVGCAPGAMASAVIVYLAGGAIAFSLALTTVATLLSPLLTPLLVEALGGAFMAIPFWDMVWTTLLTVVLPLGIGMAVRRLLGQGLPTAEAVAPAVASLAIVVICSYAVAANQTRIDSAGPLMFALVVVVNGLGYLLGWQAARLFRFDQRHRVTLAIEIGMQNAGLGVVLALKHFSPEAALPGALFAVWCILTSSGATTWLRWSRARQALPAA